MRTKYNYIVLILTATVLSYSSSQKCSTDSTCGKHETVNTCSSPCSIPATCEYPYPRNTSDTCIERCDIICECLPGYVKINEKNGPCIKIEDCPSKNRCGRNEDIGCVPCCEVTCLDLHKCDGVICPKICVKGCTCKEGFVLNRPHGTCIPIAQCPK